MAKTWPNALPSVAAEDRLTSPLRTARQLRPDEVDVLVARYGEGVKVGELTAEFGQHRATVGRHLRACGIETQPRALSDEQVTDAAELYRAGWSSMRIARKYGVNDGTVRTYLVAAGVEVRPKGRPRKLA